MITHIQYNNLKGRSGRHSLAPFTVISGRNFAGKTTITTAIMLACLGHLPVLGKQNKATFRLSSGGKMEVRAEFEGKTFIRRSWTQGAKNITAGKEGEAPDLGPVLNPAQFIGANSNDRIAILAGLSAGTEDAATAELRKLVGKPNDPDMNLFEFADSAAEKYEAEAKEAEAKRKEWAGTMAGLVDLINNAGIPARPQNTAVAALEAAARLETDAAGILRSLEEKASAAWDANDELHEMGAPAEGDLGAAEFAEATAREEWNAANLAATRAYDALHAHRQKILGCARSIRGNGTIEALAQWIADVEKGGDPEEALRASAAQCARLDAVVREIGNRIASADSDQKTAERHLAEIGALHECPVCKAKEKGWQTAARASFQAAIGEAHRRGDAARAEAEPALTAWSAECEKKKELEGKASDWRSLEDMKLQHGAKAAFAQYKEEEPALEQQLETARDAAEEKDKALQAAKSATAAAKRLSGAAARVKELRAVIAAGPSENAVAAAKSALEAAQAACTRARDAVALEQQANRDYEEAMQREKDRAAAEANVESEKEKKDKATSKAKEIREKMKAAMSSLFGPVLKFAGPLSKTVMGRELTLNAAGEIGVQSDLSFIPFDVLSGTEQLIATIAIQAALSAAVGGVVIVDEFSRVDAENKVHLFNALNAMVKEGKLAQVIVVDHDPAFTSMAGANGAAVITPAG